MHRVALALAMTVMMVCCGSEARAQGVYPGGYVTCGFPGWYPRGWELMVRYPCLSSSYGPSYYPSSYPPAAYPYPAAGPRYSSSVHRVGRRPYLRPGWWW